MSDLFADWLAAHGISAESSDDDDRAFEARRAAWRAEDVQLWERIEADWSWDAMQQDGRAEALALTAYAVSVMRTRMLIADAAADAAADALDALATARAELVGAIDLVDDCARLLALRGAT